MKTFISHREEFKELLSKIVVYPEMHAKWINTLSYLENCGARKIAACEHPIIVKEEMLKHASEEFRHAHYLKKQIAKISLYPLPDYSIQNLIGGYSSIQYLNRLDLYACRYLAEKRVPKMKIKMITYAIVTYAIELRADELYTVYDHILRKNRSTVHVKSILMEEVGHLEEMQKELSLIENGEQYAHAICLLEANLCQQWLRSLNDVINDRGVYVV